MCNCPHPCQLSGEGGSERLKVKAKICVVDQGSDPQMLKWPNIEPSKSGGREGSSGHAGKIQVLGHLGKKSCSPKTLSFDRQIFPDDPVLKWERGREESAKHGRRIFVRPV